MSTTRTSIRDTNLASWSASGSCWNPSALASPPPVLVPDDVDLNPANIGLFASAVKFADGLNAGAGKVRTFNFKTVGQGSEGCVDFANGVEDVMAVAEAWGQGGANGTQLSSFKGGVKRCGIAGPRNCSGKQCMHRIGFWCDENQGVDEQIDISDPRLAGPMVFGRGLWSYLCFNRKGHKVGGCKLAFWLSLGSWLVIVAKDLEVWLVSQKWVPTSLKLKIDPAYGT